MQCFRTWTNYTTCMDHEKMKFVDIINLINTTFLIISLLCLLFSLTIFYTFKTLHCDRVTIHKNLFLSMSLNNVSWLMLYIILYNIKDSFILCRIVYSITTYFMMATYFWMLCEGIFLRELTKSVVISDFVKRSLIVLGWGGPLLVVVPYIYFKYSSENQICWMDNGFSNLILAVPTMVILGLNTIILITIIITIKKKKLNFQNISRTGQSDSNSATLLNIQFLKPILILTPVLGLQFFILPTRPVPGSYYEYMYEVISCLSTSTQGISMSLLLCFCNKQIMKLLKLKIKRAKQNLTINILSLTSQRPSSSKTSIELDTIM